MTFRRRKARLGDLFAIWTTISKAGAISQCELRESLRLQGCYADLTEDLDPKTGRLRSAVWLFRDIQSLLESNLVSRHETDTDPYYTLHPSAGGFFVGPSYASKLGEIPAEIRENLRRNRPLSQEEHQLLNGVLDLRAAAIPEGPGARLVARMMRQLETLVHPSILSEERVVYQGMVPEFKKSLDKIPDNLQDEVLRAIRERLQVEVTLSNKKHYTLNPRRIINYNLRPRLEGLYRYQGGYRLVAVPLHWIKRFKVCESRFQVQDGLSDADTILLNQTWGLDAGEPLTSKETPVPLHQRKQTVLLRFTDRAVQAIEADPGCQGATIEYQVEQGETVLIYRVETIVGNHFKRWILAWGSECEVLEPAELRNFQRQEAEKLLKRFKASH